MKLHWQILIAIILAVFLGILFPSSYIISSGITGKSGTATLPESVIDKLQTVIDLEYHSKGELLAAIKPHLSPQDYDKFKEDISRIAYHNPFVDSVAWLGTLFLRLLKMLIIPLIFSSMISGITNIRPGENLGRIMLKTFAYYIFTSLIAILTGLFFVNLLKPGKHLDSSMVAEVDVHTFVQKQKGVKEIILDIVPQNIFQAIVENRMLSIIFFAILFGFFVTKVSGHSRKVLSDFFNAVFEVMMKITMLVIRFTPAGVFAIILKLVADQEHPEQLFAGLGMYMLSVILALSFHFIVSLPVLTRLLAKVNPFRHLKNMASPLLTAFSTSSSGATLPLTMEAVEHKSGVSNKISSFTLPLGATINMDGTVLYECVAAIFIAQAYGLDLDIYQQFIIVITALLASIGAAAIPMAGLVMISVILTAVGLPLEGIGLILAVDRILDMFRTATNVWSDTNAAVIIAKSEGEMLKL